MLDRPCEYSKMADVELSLWWYRSLHALVLQSLRAAGIPKTAPLLDAGCGTGGLLVELQRDGYDRVSAFDLSDDALAACRSRGFNPEKLDIREAPTHFAPGSFQALISCDVLCYLPDAPSIAKEIAALSTLVSEGGLLLFNLPAYQAFAGMHDLSVGIQHRSTAAELRAAVSGAGLELVRLCHWPFFLSPLIYGTRLRQRRLLRGEQAHELHSDIDVPSAPINASLNWLTQLENRLLGTKPWGSSIFLVARRGHA